MLGYIRAIIALLTLSAFLINCDKEDDYHGELISGVQFADPLFRECVLRFNKQYTYDVRALDCSMVNISSLAGLEGFVELRSLYAYKNQITDLTPLSDLTDIRAIDLHANQIVSLQGLSKMTDLTEVLLYENQIQDLTPLSASQTMRALSLGDNQISNLTPLSSVKLLESLGLEKNQISDLTPLKSLPALYYLSLWRNQVTDLTPLQSMFSLGILNLSENKISDVTPLSALVYLNTLTLDGQWSQATPTETPIPLTNVAPLASLTDLNQLYLDHNAIADVSALTTLEDLQYLSLSYNLITDASQFIDFQSLGLLLYLDLSYNDIRLAADSLAKLKQLISLNLEGNNNIPCSQLDALETALSKDVVIRPSTCYRPIADPGDPQSVTVGATVQLNGSGTGQEAITGYFWVLVEKPWGSVAVLSNQNIAAPTFVADQPGRYVVELTVTDSTGLSEPAQTLVVATAAH